MGKRREDIEVLTQASTHHPKSPRMSGGLNKVPVMDFLRGQFKKLKVNLQLARFANHLPSTQFISGEPYLVKASESLGSVAILPADLVPGYQLLGHFGMERDRYGKLTMVSWGEETRCVVGLPGLQLYLYPNSQPRPDQLWDINPDELCDRVLSACLECLDIAPELVEFGLTRLLQVDKENLRAARLFRMVGGPLEGVRLTLTELRRAVSVRLLNGKPNLASQERGVINLHDSPPMRQVLRRYNIPFSHTLNSIPNKPQKIARRRPQKRSEDPIEVSFGKATRRGIRIEFPIFESSPLIIDFERSRLRVPVEDGALELLLDSDLKVEVHRKSWAGDLKRHEVYTIIISHGSETFQFTERYKDYYEGGTLQMELDVYQDRAKAIVSALEEALNPPGSPQSLIQLVRA